MARTDVHRPSAIRVEDYSYVGIECFGTDVEPMELQREREVIRAHMAKTGGTYSAHAHGGNCAVCGNANAMFTALFHHEPTNTYVRMGRDCADKCDMGNERAFRRITDAVTAAREAKAGKLRAEGVLNARDLSAAWAIYTGAGEGNEEATIRDIVGRLVRYGNMSDAQETFLRNLLSRIEKRTEVQAAREQERAAAQPVREGRFTIAAEVVSVKLQENGFGTRRVMTIRTAEGWMAWGTAPADCERGQMINITATFAVSDSDPKFGFFKRPIARITAEAPAV
jgi:hypothetical protein